MKVLLRRVGVAALGGLLVVVGLVLVPLPGPGWAIVFSGVAVLGSEFPWAERLLHRVRALFGRGARWVRSTGLPVRAAVGVGLVASLVVPFLLVLA